jgi:hypothetical protein
VMWGADTSLQNFPRLCFSFKYSHLARSSSKSEGAGSVFSNHSFKMGISHSISRLGLKAEDLRSGVITGSGVNSEGQTITSTSPGGMAIGSLMTKWPDWSMVPLSL